jgi:predicted amidohydrolase YtcJ
MTLVSTTRATRARGARLSAAVVAALASAAVAHAQTPAGAPDLVVFDARVVTIDKAFSIAHAFAVKDGRFVAVGDDTPVLALAGPTTRKIDLRGATVLPGFNDTHVHQLTQGQILSVAVDLTNIHSIAEIQKALVARAAQSKPGEWIQGTRGWWEYELAENRIPDRFDLDKVSPNNPVVIPGPHYAVANSLALKLARITKDTPDPAGGEIRKDPKTGEPTGVLFDNASRPVTKLLPRPTKAQAAEGLLKAMVLDNANGLTSIGEPSGSMEELALYKDLYEKGQLTTRVDFAFNIDPEDPIDKVQAELAALGPPGHQVGEGMLRADEIGETGLDGAELTALLRESYPGRPDYKGLAKVPQERFNQFAAAVAKAGYRLRPHVVGDAAIDEALTAFEYADKATPLNGRRWMIDHDFLLLPDHYPRVSKLGLILNSQYMHNAQLGPLILRAWGPGLANKSEAYKDWVAHGLMIAGGSDGPISYHAGPIYEIYGEVTRQTLWGGSLGPDQGITREQAIRTVTINGAYTTFEENVKGSIEAGKYADFVVLSGDILTVPAERIKDLNVRATVLAGKTVYGDLAEAAGR